jgi:thiamine-phosphate pyrophosphorylase
VSSHNVNRPALPAASRYNPSTVDTDVLRILDANANRAREGLRVLEEHARLVLDDAELTERIKRARHALAAAVGGLGKGRLLAARNIEGDVGTHIATATERSRAVPGDVARAAAGRLTESLRCIEEYGKLIDATVAGQVERLRYEAYAIEQAIFHGGPKYARLRRAKLHVLVTESLCALPWEQACEEALAGGADVLQLREKSLPDGELLRRAELLRTLTRRRDALLIINDRPDIARLAEADGVHLGRDDLTPSQARRILGPHALIGLTVHSPQEAASALPAASGELGGCGPDGAGPAYLGVGPMFASPTKPDVAVGGPALLAEVASLTAAAGLPELPLVAIGGVTLENAGQLASMVDGVGRLAVAVCQGVISTRDPAAATRGIRRLIRAPSASERV